MIKSLGQFFSKADSSAKGNSKEELQISEYEEIIKSVLKDFGLNPEPKSSEEDNLKWSFNRGSASIYVSLYKNESLDGLAVDVIVPLITLPQENILGLFNQCMSMNFYLVNCHLALKDDMIVLTNSRAALGLDREEFAQTLRILGRMGDGLDNSLAEEFNAKMFGSE